jgi:hypothetical protein
MIRHNAKPDLLKVGDEVQTDYCLFDPTGQPWVQANHVLKITKVHSRYEFDSGRGIETSPRVSIGPIEASWFVLSDQFIPTENARAIT